MSSRTQPKPSISRAKPSSTTSAASAKPRSRTVPGNADGKPRSKASLQSSTLAQHGSPISNGLISLHFEVRGKVQGVYFRKYTQMKANDLKLRGWCKNTEHGTVIGCVEGDRVKVDMMKDWLRRIGSPKSRIDAVEFKHSKSVADFSFDDFQIVK